MSDEVMWGLADLHEIVPTNATDETNDLAQQWGDTARRGCDHDAPWVAIVATPFVYCFACAENEHEDEWLTLLQFCASCSDASTATVVLGLGDLTLMIPYCDTHHQKGCA